MTKKEKIDPKKLKELLVYSPETGHFRWADNVPAWGARQPGWEAGSIAQTGRVGYKYWQKTIFVEGNHYVASHVAWAWMTGKWPKVTIDHKNRNSADNRWENLREATKSQQKQNTGIRKDNKTGFKCVVHVKSRNRYRWRVTVNGQRLQGPTFMTPEEAYADYQTKLREWHGEFANDGR